MSDNTIDKNLLKDIFNSLIDLYYVVIKLDSNFPDLKYGSDIDIFCFDLEKATNLLIRNLGKNITESEEIKIIRGNSHLQIDYCDGKNIALRFDLYGSIPKYNNIKIKDSLFSTIIENREKKIISDIPIYLPAKTDDLILRYIEYHSYFYINPDKIKHIDYINKQLRDNFDSKKQMLEKLHYYLQIPINDEKRTISKLWVIRYVSYLYGRFRTMKTLISTHGILYVIKYSFKKIFKND